MTSDGDVIVLFHSNVCGHCKKLLSIWSPETGSKKDNVVNALKKIDSKLRFIVIEVNENWKQRYPASLVSLVSWFPTVMYFTAEEWNKGLRDLSYVFDKNTPRINTRNNDQTGRAEFTREYEYNVVGFVEWFKKIAKGSSAKRIEHGVAGSSSGEPLLVPDREREDKKKKKKGVCLKSPVTVRRR